MAQKKIGEDKFILCFRIIDCIKMKYDLMYDSQKNKV